jgi:hypothetical protein
MAVIGVVNDFEVEDMSESARAAFPTVTVHDRGNGIAVVDLVVFEVGGHRSGIAVFNERRNGRGKDCAS